MTRGKQGQNKGATMAADPTSNDSSPIDFKKAVKDYSLLIAMLKWGAVIALITGFLVMIIIAN
jgi:hypothetical protein